jgi:1-acyl-sn-glycerol-3-phosphate acyltransferase
LTLTPSLDPIARFTPNPSLATLMPFNGFPIRMKKFLFWPYQLYVWLVFFPLAAIITLVFGGLTAIFATLVNPHFASRVFGVTWARWLAHLTPMGVTVIGGENAGRRRSYVVVSNHQSMYDIFVLYGWLELDMKWVMKKELRRIPGIGIGCEKAGHIFIDRRNPKAARKTLEYAIRRLGDGIGILFFPEGTRSTSGRLLPFKKGAFRTAIEQQLPILPVTIVGTRDILPNKTLALYPGDAQLIVHPCIETAGMDSSRLDELLEQSRKVIESAMPAELG